MELVVDSTTVGMFDKGRKTPDFRRPASGQTITWFVSSVQLHGTCTWGSDYLSSKSRFASSVQLHGTCTWSSDYLSSKSRFASPVHFVHVPGFHVYLRFNKPSWLFRS